MIDLRKKEREERKQSRDEMFKLRDAVTEAIIKGNKLMLDNKVINPARIDSLTREKIW